MKILILIFLCSMAAMAQQDAVPVEQEPNHKTILQNSFLQVFRVTLLPGKSTLFHTHSHNDVAIRLSEAKVINEVAGRTNSPNLEHTGTVSARTNEGRPFTHRMNNVGDTTFDVLDVQILKRPDGPETRAITTAAAENPGMRVYRYELAPGESSPVHTHERPYLIVAATDMKLKMTSPDGQSSSHPVQAGDLHWIDAKVTHTLTNDGDTKGVLAEVELK